MPPKRDLTNSNSSTKAKGPEEEQSSNEPDWMSSIRRDTRERTNSLQKGGKRSLFNPAYIIEGASETPEWLKPETKEKEEKPDWLKLEAKNPVPSVPLNENKSVTKPIWLAEQKQSPKVPMPPTPLQPK